MHTSINNKSNGIEISFDSKPDSQTLYLLREQLGFKWSSKNKVWYRRDINKSIIDLLKSREVTAFEMLTLQSIVNEAAKTETQYKWLADALNDYQTDLDNDFELEVSSETISRLKKIPTIKPLKPAINKTSTKIARLSGLEMVPADNDPYEAAGLGKAVVGNEVYQIITDMVLKTIKESKELVWRKPWKSIETYGIGATNFHTKKAYRGANSFLLNFIAPLLRKKDWDIPYFLTFNQVEKLGGKVKKDAKGYIVTYYQVVYKLGGKQISEEQYWNYYNQCRDKDSNINRDICKKLDDYAMLKYYKVFNADDIEGIDWKLEKVDNTTTKERIAAAEAILLNYPKPKPSFVSKDADQAYYMPATDEVNMPPIESFEKEPFYYSVFFHELIHSTGHKKRLNREKGGRFGDKKYSFEELIAELGATLLCGQSGILYHTINNSSAYLKGWMEGLVDIMSEDNTFFMKAAGKAQAGADFILQPDKNGVPAYLKPTKKVTSNKKQLQMAGTNYKVVKLDDSTVEGFIDTYLRKNTIIEEYKMSSKILKKYGLDDLQLVELIMGLEKAFDVSISDEEVKPTITFGQLIKLVKAKIKNPKPRTQNPKPKPSPKKPLGEVDQPGDIWVPIIEPKFGAMQLLETQTGSYDQWEHRLYNSDSQIGIILGKRGSGKSGIGMKILENASKKTSKQLVAIGFNVLPDFILNVESIEDIPNNSFVLIDEAGITFNSRDSMSSANKMLSTLLKIARHKNITVIFISQNSSNLDVDIIRQTDFMILKPSSLFQRDYERKNITRIYDKQQAGFQKYSNHPGLAFIYSNEFTGFINNSLPSFWTESTSKSFA